jgi:hypothetical protein
LTWSFHPSANSGMDGPLWFSSICTVATTNRPHHSRKVLRLQNGCQVVGCVEPARHRFPSFQRPKVTWPSCTPRDSICGHDVTGFCFGLKAHPGVVLGFAPAWQSLANADCQTHLSDMPEIDDCNDDMTSSNRRVGCQGRSPEGSSALGLSEFRNSARQRSDLASSVLASSKRRLRSPSASFAE